MFKKLFFLCVLVFSMNSYANDNDAVHGVWQLKSYEVESQESGDIMHPMGENPTGYVILTPETRIWFVLTAEGREPAQSIEDKAHLLNTIIAYTGTYRIEDNHFITNVEVAWNPQWVGTEQARQFTIEGDTLRILTPWRVMPNWPDATTRSIVTFQRTE